MSNIRRTLAIKVQTPGGDNPLQMQLVGDGPFVRGIPVSGLALVGKGGTAPYALSIIAGGDSSGGVNGLTLNTDGTFSGSGDASGRFVFVAEIADDAGSVFQHSFSITFLSQLFVVAGTPIPGEIGQAYSYQFVVRDAAGTTLTSGYSLESGNYPAGASLTSGGLLHATTLTAPDGISYFTLSVTDGTDTIKIPCSVTVYPEVTLSFLEDRDPPHGWGGGAGSWLPSIIRGVEYMAHVVITGGLGPYTVNVNPSNPLPTGMKYDNGTRRITGTTMDAASASVPILIELSVRDVLGRSPPVTQRAILIIDAQQGRIIPQRNGSDVVGGGGATKFNFIEGANVTLDMSNDGDTLTIEIAATAPSGGIESINGVGPDSSGNLAIAGVGTDSNGDLFIEPTGGSGVASVNGATGVVTETSNDGSLGHADTAGAGGNVDWTGRLLAKLVAVAALPANTYANGTAGVGATLTGNATGTLTVDGTLVALNDYLVVPQEAAQSHNGLYKCTTAGAVGVAYVLTRATRMDSTGKYVGAQVFITGGSTGAIRVYACANGTAPTVGTTAITFNAITFASGVNGSFSNMSATILNGIVIAAANGSATADIQIFTASGTWTKPPNAKTSRVYMLGAGGGGASGGVTSGANTFPTPGGGGGACRDEVFDSTILGSTETVTIGTAGAGGTASNTTTRNGGTSGGNTTFGAWLTGFGGGGTPNGAIGGGNAPGAGAGSLRAGGVPASVNATAVAGRVGGTTQASGNATIPLADATSPWGGAAGGCGPVSNAGLRGGDASGGGPGGGSAGGTTTSTGLIGGDGGFSTGCVGATGGTSGGTGSANAGDGADGTNPAGLFGAGSAGGGGGSCKTINPGAGIGGKGGNGGRGAGGGGGGNSGISGNSKAGGDGGPGYCVVITLCSS